MDEQTVFAIASCSKAFTSAAIAISDQENVLHWNDQVKDILPLKLQDEFGDSKKELNYILTNNYIIFINLFFF